MINLSENKIKKIEKITFHGLEKVMKINLSRNQIENIDPATFSGLTNLVEIKLHDNMFTNDSLELILEENIHFISFKHGAETNDLDLVSLNVH